MDDNSEFDWQVRREVYEAAMQRGATPSVAELAVSLAAAVEQIQAALGRLAAAHVLVLQPETGEILMAAPFSAVPTPFLVELAGFSCYGNCIWDALAIPAMLRQDARIVTSCADCGGALQLSVVEGQVRGDPGLVHFALPARRWWDDIVFT